MVKRLLSLLIGLALVIGLSMPLAAGDLDNVITPMDRNLQPIESLIGVGTRYKVCSSTDPVSIATPPVLIYSTLVASDGSGTDYVKIISTYTTASITDALTIDEVQSTTSECITYGDTPILVTGDYCYIVVNDTNTFSRVQYMQP